MAAPCRMVLQWQAVQWECAVGMSLAGARRMSVTWGTHCGGQSARRLAGIWLLGAGRNEARQGDLDSAP